jgi:hypothetical protein
MIQVVDIFNRVRDLSKKDKSGYLSSEEFNRNLNETQQILLDYYFERFGRDQYDQDSINPFLKEERLPIVNGFVDFPSDYRHRVEVGNIYIENVYNSDCTVSNPKVEELALRYLHPSEERLTLNSAIRKPSIKKKLLYHTFVNNKIRIRPSEAQGTIALKYIMSPPEAKYATVVNVNTDKEDYDPINSVDLIWNEQDKHNIVDIMLMFLGIQIRESALINWVQARRQIIDENRV